ncbi:uncharacterized protein LOC119281413 [Triticum dicoccoides]|uniref:F-box domain-containing protein n=1 Tax=Triticum turgidum subsp. durum TaxID=4567 RepID=A0A9R1QJE5_TRITD|nr:uncharacterized protein LOC119281413 [Triticum dicoccoides]XP_037417829.1 uncharacterized protein LOC119281413 [Triticum dicoccoides]XP_037417830.1 uncharacterized protein LOC119281413 [Triticum dicoccoides]XP_044344732.1 uncharacterized protein LOC123065539 [Triticum aestivum]VAH78510.1 unnamed protein product [Triticum turgidum subsp. durum]
MGRKLPALAPAGAAAAGRKRKGATLTTLAACKRPARAQVIGGWASLPTDIVGLITCRLLAGDGDGDVVDYIAFRAVCSGWRACTPTARDPTLRDPRLRPRGWVALCDGDAVRLDDACEIVFFHTRTARRLRVLLPELRQHRIVGFTDGLLILVHKRTTEVRVLHPFTRVVVDFPPLAPVYHAVVRRMKLLDMSAAICSSASSATSIAVVVWFLCTSVVLGADPGSDWAEVFMFGIPCPSKESSMPPPCLHTRSCSYTLLPDRNPSRILWWLLMLHILLIACIAIFYSWSLVEGCCSSSGTQLLVQRTSSLQAL